MHLSCKCASKFAPEGQFRLQLAPFLRKIIGIEIKLIGYIAIAIVALLPCHLRHSDSDSGPLEFGARATRQKSKYKREAVGHTCPPTG